MIEVNTYVTGPLGVNTTVIKTEDSIIIIDPGADITSNIKHSENIAKICVLLTHGHVDHLAGVPAVKKAFPKTEIIINKKDMPLIDILEYQSEYLGFLPIKSFFPDLEIEGDGSFGINGLTVRYLEIGGHTAGSTVFVIDNIIYSGDTLFNFAIGRTDLMGSTTHNELVENIRKKIMTFPDSIKVVPGHGSATTVGFERKENLYVNERSDY